MIDTCWANSTMMALALSSNSSLVFFFCFFSVATTSVSGLFFQSYRRSIWWQTTTTRSENRKKRRKDIPDDEEVTHLVEGDDEGTLLLLQQVDGLKRLRLQAVHDVHHQDGDVAQRAASVPQVTECTHREQLLRTSLKMVLHLEHYQHNRTVNCSSHFQVWSGMFLLVILYVLPPLSEEVYLLKYWNLNFEELVFSSYATFYSTTSQRELLYFFLK